jgi:AraC-like DNA-binding protein
LIEDTVLAVNKPDRLSGLIQRFRVRASVPQARIPGAADEEDGYARSNLLIIRRGRLRMHRDGAQDLNKGAPALIFFPRGMPPDLAVYPEGEDAEYVCASVDTGGEANPIALALPELVVVPLRQAPSLEAVTDMLLDEVLSPRCGGQAVMDRLCEVVVIRLLRHLIEAGSARMGLVAGLAHPNLSRAIVAMHDRPDRHLRLEGLAEVAGMSRTHFANTFRDVVGVTPGEYLSSWRLTLARVEIANGTSLKAIVDKVGFSSSAALSRAFKRKYGVSPRQADLIRPGHFWDLAAA